MILFVYSQNPYDSQKYMILKVRKIKESHKMSFKQKILNVVISCGSVISLGFFSELYAFPENCILFQKSLLRIAWVMTSHSSHLQNERKVVFLYNLLKYFKVE